MGWGCLTQPGGSGKASWEAGDFLEARGRICLVKAGVIQPRVPRMEHQPSMLAKLWQVCYRNI